jgi:hypothetical protein
MMEAVRTSETSVDNNFTRQYIPEDSSEQDVFISWVALVPEDLCSMELKCRLKCVLDAALRHD